MMLNWGTEVAASKATAIEATLEVSSKIFEVMGASAGLSKYAFDRFWRNTRCKWRFLIIMLFASWMLI